MRHLINPDELAKTLGIPWKHYEVPEYSSDGRNGDQFDEGSFIFKIPSKNGPIIFSFHDRQPDEVVVSLAQADLTIRFGHITRLVLVRYQKRIILESKMENYFSQLWVNHEGRIKLRLGVPLKDYRLASWCEIEEQEQKEIDENKGKSTVERLIQYSKANKNDNN